MTNKMQFDLLMVQSPKITHFIQQCTGVKIKLYKKLIYFIWVDLGYAPAAHVLILFSVPCIVLRVEPSQKHTFFCPLSGGVIFFGGGFLVQKLHPKN